MEIPKRQRILKMFGEYALFSGDERQEATQYLDSWKKFILRRLSKECNSLHVLDEQWNERAPEYVNALETMSLISLKIVVEFLWTYEDGVSINGTDLDEEKFNWYLENKKNQENK